MDESALNEFSYIDALMLTLQYPGFEVDFDDLQRASKFHFMILHTNNLQKSTSAGSVCLPKLETVSAPLVQFDCTSQVHLWIAWRLSFAALSPINVVDLPKSHISRSIRVVVDCMCVSSTFMGDNALTALLVP